MRPSRPVRILAWIGLVLWCAATWVVSSRERPPDATWSLPIPDWAAHIIEYAPGGALAFLVIVRSNLRSALLATLVFGSVWGLLDEWHQSFVPGRDASGTDLAADVMGTAVGAALAALWARRRASADVSGNF